MGSRIGENRPLRFNPEPLNAVEDRETASVQSFAEWAKTRSREDRLRIWLALGGSEDEFPAAAVPEENQ